MEILEKPNPLLAPCARKIWSLVRPQDVVGHRMVRKGRDFDGGYVMVDHRLENATAYSLGINDDVSWDLDMVAYGCEVYQYDHTIDALPFEHPRMHWEKIGITDRRKDDPTFKTLTELIAINGHKALNNLVLKMDIEGIEWGVLETISQNTLQQFSQLIIELHWLQYIDETYHFRKFVHGLGKLNSSHQIVHVHANNCGKLIIAGGVPLPETLEVTWARRGDYSFSQCTRLFPTELDMPCDHAKPDLFLGALGLL